jgi:transketolase
MLLYSLLHLTGYDDFPLDELKQFRQWDSKTAGHPERHLSKAIETTTGPLGQGFANGVGMAIGAEFLAATFNTAEHKPIDYFIYAIVSDGDLMEGVAAEAASLAGHLKLGRLIYLYDDNDISLDGPTAMSFTEDRLKRFESYGWHVQQVNDGNDTAGIAAAIEAAQKDLRPSLISVRSIIGFGSPNKQGTSHAHGEPLGVEEVKLTKQNLGWPYAEAFTVPEEALAVYRACVEKGAQQQNEWAAGLEAYTKANPELAAQWQSWMSGALPEGWEAKIPVFPAGTDVATRDAGGAVLNALAGAIPMLLGGAADLRGSNKTFLKGLAEFSAETRNARNFNFGVREHAMGAALNGMALTAPLIPYGGTFLVFSQYMLPAVRLAAMMELQTIYVWTHDSIYVGEDGPTHEPVEQLAMLRALPGLNVFRPADANETAMAWRSAIEHRHTPTALLLTRQKLPTVDRTKYASAEGTLRGAYVLSDTPTGVLDLILLATGSEVAVALAAQDELAKHNIGVRVVSMPCWEIFDAQPVAYHHEVLPPHVSARVAIEAGVSMGWHKYVGAAGEIIALDRFGASAPYQVLQEKFGFTAANVVARVLKMAGK